MLENFPVLHTTLKCTVVVLIFYVCLVCFSYTTPRFFGPLQTSQQIRIEIQEVFPPFSALLHDDTCSQFKGDIESELYLNFTAGNFLYPTHRTNVHAGNGSYHFAIASAPNNFHHRHAIRSTWAKLFQPHKACRQKVTYAFYIGKTSDPVVAMQLKWEMAEYPEDMVFMDFCDAYENLPLKTYNMMAHASRTYPEVDFVIKMDDDVLPNFDVFFRCFHRIQEPGAGLYGWIHTDPPSYDKGYKWRINAQRYNKTFFPNFAHGPAYIIRISELPKLLDAGARIPMINLEDVWFTGFVADLAGVTKKDVPWHLHRERSDHEWSERNVLKSMRRSLFYHDISPEALHQAWTSRNHLAFPSHCDADTKDDFCDAWLSGEDKNHMH